ncbi:Cytochrome P450 [Sesbania bispinosa]|nr:Cytochrome P450 [Sesbania bispinosa]
MSFPSFFSLFLLFTFTFILSVTLLRRKQEKDDRRRRIPPGPPGFPVIGNLHMLGKLPHRTLEALAKRYGPVMSLRLGQVPTIVVSSSEAAEQFLKTHDVVFASRPRLEATNYLTYGSKGLVFSEYGAYWRNMRKICTLKLLSSSKVDSFAPLRNRELQLTVKSLTKFVGEVVDLSEVVQNLVEDIVYKMMLGCSRDDEFDLKGLIHQGMNLAGTFNLADYVPCLGPLDLQGLRRSFKKIGKALDQVFEKIIKEHEQGLDVQSDRHHKDFIDILLSLMHQPVDPYDEQNHGLRRNFKKTSKALDQVLEKIIKEHEHGSNVQSDKHHKDFIDILLSLMHHPVDPYDEQNIIIDRTNIKAVVLEMIVGAFETSAPVVEWALSELLRHPRVMKNLQDELDNVVGLSKLVQENDLTKLSYLDIVIKETLRLHPAGVLVPRESTEDVMVDGYFIEKKSRIIINLWAMGRDCKIWSDNAEVFYPERFINRNLD